MTLPEKPIQFALELPLEAPESSIPEAAAPQAAIPRRPPPPKPIPVPERPEVAVAPEPAPEPLPKLEEILPEPPADVFEPDAEVEPESVSQPQSVEPEVSVPPQNQLPENPRPGTGSAQAAHSENLSNIYLQHVYQRIQRAKRYPRFAREREMEGRIQVEFVLSRDGKLLESRVVNSSGHSVLDREALLTLRRAAPFPKLPETIQAGNVVMNVVISFVLQ